MMELFNNADSEIIYYKGAAIIRYTELPEVDKSELKFKNGSSLLNGDLVTGIGVRETLKKNKKGFEMQEGCYLEYFGICKDDNISDSKVVMLFHSRQSKDDRLKEPVRMDGYFYFYFFIYTSAFILLPKNRSIGMNFNPVFTKEAA